MNSHQQHFHYPSRKNYIKNSPFYSETQNYQKQSKKFKELGVTPEGEESDSSMPVRLITSNKVSSGEESIWDIEKNVRDKLKRKQIFLPNIPISPRSHTIKNTNSPSIQKMKRRPHRFKTEQNQFQASAQQQLDSKYDQTIVQIKQLNHNFNRQNRKKHPFQNNRNQFYSDNYQYLRRDLKNSRRAKITSLSRQQEFQKYVDYLQDQYWMRGKLYKKGFLDREKERQIQRKLASRVETRKRNTRQMYNNPELDDHRNISQEKGQDSRTQSRFKSIDQAYIPANKVMINNNARQESSNNKKSDKKKVKFQNNYADFQAINSRTLDQINNDSITTNQSRMRKQNHNNFIKLLRMAKNRGESLLVKLKKYPYDKKSNMNLDKQ